jgi:hypothetical protein
MDMFACGHALAIPCAEADLGLPADGRERWRELCQAQVQMPPDFGRLPVRPSPCDQGTTGMGMPGFGTAALLPPRPTGIVRGCEPQRMQQLSRVLEACQVAQLRPGRHGHGALDPAQGLEGFDHGSAAPGFDLLGECEFETPSTFRLLSDGLDVFLKDERLRRCRTNHLDEPSQVSGTPGGPAGRAASVPQSEGLETQLGCLQIPEGLVPCPTQGAERCIVEGRDRDRGEVPGAQEPGQWPGVTPVGLDPVTCLFGHEGGRDHPADRVFFGQLTIEPVPTRAGFRDKDQVFSLRWQLPNQGVDVTLPGAKGPQGEDRGVMLFGDVGHSDRLFVNIHSDVKRARLGHG